LVSPVTVQGDDAHVPVCPPEEVAVYDVMAEPPSLAGAEKLTVACALPAVAVPIVGAPGVVAGVTLLEAADAGPAPTPLVAVTVNVYAVPLARTRTVHGDVAHVPVCPPEDVAVYDVIAEPPSLAGGVKVTVACALPAVAVPMVGAPGTVAGVTLLDADDAGPVPTAFDANTVNVYAVPFARPVTVHGDVAQVPVCPPDDVAVYDVMVEPPLLAGGVKVTVACALPAVAVPIVGAPGTVAGVTLLEAEEAGPVPTAFVAVTVNVYAVPLVSPVTVQGDEAHVPVWPPEEVAV
jgi:hypothetical protein